ncbi:MAG TPA: hypothetical protein DCQ28_02175 [Bacteroidetes bacterium]|nr:hypothetical protein [Bacteroidota bacterium]
MLKVLWIPRNGVISLLLLSVCIVLAYNASRIGIDDNPPGIAFAYLSAIALVFVFVHPWRTSKQYRYLIYASGIGFILFAILHNVFEGIASVIGETSIVYGMLNVTGVVCFLIAILVCPSGLLVGTIGAGIMSIREHRSKHRSLAG